MADRLSVVIPARDEASTIGEVVAALRRAHPNLAELIVVDDGSRDQTAANARSAGATVVRHGIPRGYGAAIKSGILAATRELILTIDGDGQHHAADVAALLAASDSQDLVSGHRAKLLHTSAWRLPGKWLLRRLCSYLVRQRVPDFNCGLRLYRRDVILRYLPLCSDAYSFTATSLVLLLSRGHRVRFIPIQISPGSSQGRVTVRTGFDTFLLLLRMATFLDPLRVFIPISGICFLLGIAWGLPYALAGRGVSVGALLLLLTALLLFAVGLLSDQIAQLRQERLQR